MIPQPSWLREPIPFKKIEWSGRYSDEYYNRIAFFDPTDIYGRIGNHIDPYKRHQGFAIHNYFPDKPGECACGCGKQLTGRRTRWASRECHDLATAVYNIFYGVTGTIYYYLSKIYGDHCSCCGRDHRRIYDEDVAHLPSTDYATKVHTLAVDHIIPVKHGGGGGWLKNYQLLCRKCHTKKTNKDFGWSQDLKNL